MKPQWWRVMVTCDPVHTDAVAAELVMLTGQGRERIFPNEMALHLDGTDSASLADALITLCGDPSTLKAMGDFGANHVRKNYTLPVVAQRLAERLALTF